MSYSVVSPAPDTFGILPLGQRAASARNATCAPAIDKLKWRIHNSFTKKAQASLRSSNADTNDMPELSIETVIRALPTEELLDAIETILDVCENQDAVWPVLAELERRIPGFSV